MTSPFEFLKRWLHDAARPRRLRKVRQRRQLRLESLETRTLLAGDTLAAIAGTVFVDVTDDGLTPDDLPLATTVYLYLDGGDGVLDRGVGGGDDTPKGSQPTDASGRYRFDGLGQGTYFVEQEPVSGLLQRPDEDVQEVEILPADADGTTGMMIDSFDSTTQSATVTSIVPTSDSDATSAGEALGDERDLFVELLSGEGEVELEVNFLDKGLLTFSNKLGALGRGVVTWDGIDNDADQLDPVGLGGVDLTENGENLGIRFLVGADLPGGVMTMHVYTDAGNYSSLSQAIPQTPTGQAEVVTILRFSDFEEFGVSVGNGADLTDVGAIQLEIQGVSNLDAEFKVLGTIRPTVKTGNFINLNPLSLGDTVWFDADNNGLLDAGESGIAGVQLTLYADTDGDGQLTPGTDASLGSTTTATDGTYGFDNLLPGSYVVQVAPENFSGSGALVGLVTSTGNEPTPVPNTNIDGDDNGNALAGYGVVTAAVTLSAGGEPITDDEDPNTNLTVDFGFTPLSDLLVIKSDDPDPVTAGENLTYTLHVTNQGPSAVSGVVVTDTLPSGVTFQSVTPSQGTGSHQAGTVTVNLGSLESGGTATVSILVKVDSSTTGPLLNQAVVTGENLDPVPLNNSDDEPTDVIQEIDLAIDKTGSPATVTPGQQLTYTLAVTNSGPSDASGVQVVDTLPAGVTFVSASSSQGTVSGSGSTVTANLGSMAVGAQATVTVLVNVATTASGTLVNAATVSGSETDLETNLTNNTDQWSTTVEPRIDLEIIKADSPDPVVAGQQLTYTLSVKNNGPSTATGVTAVDTLPAGVTYQSGTATQGTVSGSGSTVTAAVGQLASGASATVTIIVSVDPATRGTITNVATVTGNETETNNDNNRDEVSTQVGTLIDLAVDKTGSPASVTPGQQLTYTLAVTNSGPSDATGVQVVDTLPAGVTFVSASSSQGTVSGSGSTVTANLGNVADGAQATVTVVVNVATTASGTLVNTATVSGSETETNLNNNTDQLSTTVEPRVDLVIFKADSPDPVVAGQQLTYTLSVTNNGPSTATGVTVVDTLPTGVTYQSATATQGTVSAAGSAVTAAVGQLASGASATVTIIVNVDPLTRGTITNVATVTGNETETNAQNNQDNEPTTVQAQVDLTVSKADSPDPVVAGQQLTYTLSVTNNGPSTATGVTVVDTLPTGVTYQSATATQGTVSAAGSTVTAAVGQLAGGASATVTIIVNVDPLTRGTITNVATVTGNETETNAQNNQDNEPTTVQAQVDLTLTKTDSSDPVQAGGQLTYTLVVTNNGPSSATGVVVTDTLPAALTYVSGSSTLGTVSHSGQAVTVNVGNMASGQSATVTLVTQIDSQFSGTITNQAEVSGSETETNTNNNADAEPTVIQSLLSSISGTVYVDADNDGQKDAGEQPISGVVIALSGTDAAGATVERQATTGADGTFSFTNLPRGTYRLTEQQPTAYKDGLDTVGSLTANTDTNDQFSGITLPAGTNAVDYLFGERTRTFSKRRFLTSTQ